MQTIALWFRRFSRRFATRPQPLKKLHGRIAIVTGAARGLGEASARALCEEGAAVILTDFLELGEATAEKLTAEGFRAFYIKHDVRSANEWQTVVEKALNKFGDISILVNNAGITYNASFEDVTLDQYKNILDVNLFGAFLGMKAVLPSMKRTGNGSIINIASTTTDLIRSIAPCYGSAKAALANLTKSAAVHCAEQDYGIRVNSVHPGAHATPMLIGPGGAREGLAADAVIPGVPMKRMGRPAEVGRVVAFLASDDASYITASEIFVDGGMTIV
jgi:3alpha(or 20beta)-hydroxysteroid dehydrogenase